MASDAVINLDRGVKFEYTVQLTGAPDLSGWSARFQVREKRDSSTSLLAEWTSDAGQITILPVEAQVQIDVAATDTANYSWDSGEYDLVLINSSGVPYRILQGTMFVSDNVLV